MISNFDYRIPQCVPQDDTQEDIQDSLNYQIMCMIKDNNKISTEAMASALGINSKTIKRRIKAMTNIRFVGSGYSGHWEIEE